MARFIAEFSDGAGTRGKWPLPSCKENCISNPAAEGLASGELCPTGLGAGEARKLWVLARLQDGA